MSDKKVGWAPSEIKGCGWEYCQQCKIVALKTQITERDKEIERLKLEISIYESRPGHVRQPKKRKKQNE